MSSTPLEPHPPIRLPAASVTGQAGTVAGDPVIRAMLEGYPGPAAVLNDRRQIVLANNDFRTIAVDLRPGVRPGDALGCITAGQACDGCGSAPACRTCGAGRSLARLEAGEASPLRDECLITRSGPTGEEACEFEAGITRLPGGWTLFALRDISGEKRRQLLERCFLHDALNLAGGLRGAAELVADGEVGMSGLVGAVAQALVEELRNHQILLAAESGDLVPSPTTFALGELLDEVSATLLAHPVGDGRALRCGGQATVTTDRVLLRRVLLNLAKNALEATPVGGEVSIAGAAVAGACRIVVGNPGEIPPEVQLQLFRRSFSTKGGGRGVGTWSIKLLTERYLGGTVSFVCADGRTAFTVALPAG